MAGHGITPVSRRHGIDCTRLRTPQDWLPLLGGIDTVINTVGIIGETRQQTFEALHTQVPVALFRACQLSNVRRVLQLSALGADDTAFSAYHRSKRAADDALRDSGLDWWVLRPSLIYGKGGTSANMLLRLARCPVIPVIDEGQQTLQPVHISDVVATVLRCLDPRGPAQQTLDVVGPDPVTYAQWLQTLRTAQGLPPARLLKVPLRLALTFIQMGRWVSPALRPDNLRMLDAGAVADVRPLVRLLGRSPHRVSPQLLMSDATGVNMEPLA